MSETNYIPVDENNIDVQTINTVRITKSILLQKRNALITARENRIAKVRAEFDPKIQELNVVIAQIIAAMEK